MTRSRPSSFGWGATAVLIGAAVCCADGPPAACPACGVIPTIAHPAAATRPTTNPAAAADHAGMAWIPGGQFAMGTDDPRFTDAAPVHPVRVAGFWIDKTDVTNAQFARFVAATGYVTVAERKPDPATLPGVPADQLVAGAVVFTRPPVPVPLDDPSQWWRYVPGACWKHPEGPASDVRGRDDHPVVEVAWSDAVAYAAWAGKRLPTEAEWEFAARGGLDAKPFVWGDAVHPGGKPMANTFQGHFPDADLATDGFTGTSPVGSFPPNGYGLTDMAGNVWQWCADWYRPDAYRSAGPGVTVNPHGPDRGFDPDEPAVPKRVQRGGSFLCTDEYCGRFAVGSRGKGDPDTPLSHVGFRCAASAAK